MQQPPHTEPQPRLCVIRWASVHESASSDTQGKEPLPPLQRALQLDGRAGGALIVARARAHSISIGVLLGEYEGLVRAQPPLPKFGRLDEKHSVHAQHAHVHVTCTCACIIKEPFMLHSNHVDRVPSTEYRVYYRYAGWTVPHQDKPTRVP